MQHPECHPINLRLTEAPQSRPPQKNPTAEVWETISMGSEAGVLQRKGENTQKLAEASLGMLHW